MGISISRRGFSDANLYIAFNSQPKVAVSKVGLMSAVFQGFSLLLYHYVVYSDIVEARRS